MEPPATALPDGLYAVVAPAWVAGFVVEHHHVTMCAPILRRRLTHWMGQARLVSPVPDGTAPHRPTVPGHSAPEAALEVDPAQPARPTRTRHPHRSDRRPGPVFVRCRGEHASPLTA